VKCRLLFVLFVLSLTWPRLLYSQTIRVAIIPLTFYSQEDLDNLRKPVMDMLVKNLKQEGFQPIPGLRVYEQAPYEEMNDSLAREVGTDLASSFVLYGSLTKLGEQISFDVRLVDVDEQRATVPIFVTRVGLENLASAVAELSREIGIRILKKKKIRRILVAGNQRIEDEAIKLKIKSKSGDVFDQAKLREDLTAIYKMGYFKDVRIEAEDTPQGQDVTFVVSEKPTISKVTIRGADKISKEDITAAIATRKYSILQRSALKGDVEKILALYRDKGYYNAEVTYEVEDLKANRVDVTFRIKENKKLYIKKITFSGNHEFSDKKLKGKIKTSEKGFFWWLTESGILKRENLEVDVDRLNAWYHVEGFVDAKVGSPTITHDEKGIYINFPVVEGQRFQVGKVEVIGDGIEPDEKLLVTLELPEEKYFNREALAKDLEKITNYYTSQGYAFAETNPKIGQDRTKNIVHIAYEVNKGELVDFGRINISGNTKTRDKVIRRELHVLEGARYSKAKLERSVRNLRRLDFFENVEMDTIKGKSPEQMNLDVKVKEKPTRFISVGGGFSSADQIFAMAQIAERNLFGRGQNLNFQGQFGSISNRFTLSFTEPWLFDIPLTSTLQLYRWYRDYDEYEKESIGAGINFSYPVWDFTRVYFGYSYDDSDVTNVDEFASTFIKDQEGRTTSSVINTTLRRDSRDHAFLTTDGSDNSLSVDWASGLLGADASYVKTIFNSAWWYPLPLWKFVGFLHGKTGYVDGSDIPIYERFFLGGINSIRSFDSGDVGPRDPLTGDRVGGNKMILFNAELLFPLVEAQGLRGVVFFDAGNSYFEGEDIDFNDLKYAYGGGIRWHSPMGPLRLEYGINPDPKDGEDKAKFQFSMGVFW